MALADLPFVRHVRQDGPRHLTLTVEDGGTATPDAVDAINERGGEVVFAREIRATFDDVFATLVARDEVTRSDATETGPATDEPPTADAPPTAGPTREAAA